MDLDRMDLKILAYLENHGRISNADLSKQVALSPSACLQRVRRLEKAGFIKQYNAEIDWKKIRNHVVIITQIMLKYQKAIYRSEFEKKLRRFPEVRKCYQLCGEFDYTVHFHCKDIDTYQDITEQILGGDIAVERMTSFVVLQEVKIGTCFNVEDTRTPSLRLVNA